jgi:hypothetical protein
MSTPPGEVTLWSVSIEVQGDRILQASEVVELADAIAHYDGIASGVGSTRYGAQIVVPATSQAEAIAKATEKVLAAAQAAGLPAGAILRAEAVSEEDE